MNRKFVFVLFIFFVIGFLAIQNEPIQEYMATLKNDQFLVTKMNDPLYMEIQEKASDYELPAIDAKIDRVWKLVPGLNGRKVNINRSFEQMKDDGTFMKEKLVFEEVKPKVHLNDLPASPIYRGNEQKQMVALVINVAWGNEYLPSMLQTLKKNHVQASFFLEGRWVKNNPEYAKMIKDAGHEIGNHSYSHPNMSKLSREQIKSEIVNTNDVIHATLGITPSLFGPPSGSFNQQVIKQAHELKMKTILWTVDTVDWKKPSPTAITMRVVSRVHPGAIILMHPTDPTSKALDDLIEGIRNKGYEIGTVSDLLNEKRVNEKRVFEKEE